MARTRGAEEAGSYRRGYREGLIAAREEIAAHPEDHILLPGIRKGLITIDGAQKRVANLLARLSRGSPRRRTP